MLSILSTTLYHWLNLVAVKSGFIAVLNFSLYIIIIFFILSYWYLVYRSTAGFSGNSFFSLSVFIIGFRKQREGWGKLKWLPFLLAPVTKLIKLEKEALALAGHKEQLRVYP